MNVNPVELGRVRLVRDPYFRNSFARFKGDNLNGWNQHKQARAGHDGLVVEVFTDKTCTVQFDDGVKMDFPWESIAQQLSCTNASGVSGTNLDVQIGMCVRLKSDPNSFQQSFSRFQGDKLNGWTQQKEAKRGMEGTVVEVFEDETFTIRFNDGVKFDLPFEAIQPMYQPPPQQPMYQPQPVGQQPMYPSLGQQPMYQSQPMGQQQPMYGQQQQQPMYGQQQQQPMYGQQQQQPMYGQQQQQPMYGQQQQQPVYGQASGVPVAQPGAVPVALPVNPQQSKYT